jgi:hypothetical protein
VVFSSDKGDEIARSSGERVEGGECGGVSGVFGDVLLFRSFMVDQMDGWWLDRDFPRSGLDAIGIEGCWRGRNKG